MAERKISYIWDQALLEQCNRLPAVIGRASMVDNLIYAYGLMSRVSVVKSAPATFNDLAEFHSESYLNHLKKFAEIEDDYLSTTEDDDFGIAYDCPPLSNMFDLVSAIAGSSICAAKSLILGIADVAINWCGGWHHAHRSRAAGFCYVNDIVLAIEKLRKKFPKVLYVDLDVHHGDGVQDAYNLSKSVFTLSFHKFEPGFYPGTGSIDDIGSQSGKGYSCNFPLHAAYSDDTMEYVFDKVFNTAYNLFKPDAIVVQCGADACARDPNGGANLTTRSYCRCVQWVLDKRKPTLLLGGGGYRHENAARLWTSITALVVGVDLDRDIPEHTHWPTYGPDYTIAVEATLEKDKNKSSYIEECINKIYGNLEKLDETVEPETKKLKTELTTSEKEPSEATVEHFDVRKTILKRKLCCPEKNKEKVVSDDIYTFVDD